MDSAASDDGAAAAHSAQLRNKFDPMTRKYTVFLREIIRFSEWQSYTAIDMKFNIFLNN